MTLEQEVYEFMTEYREAAGYFPCYEAIRDHLGISRSQLFSTIQRLKSKGLLEHKRHHFETATLLAPRKKGQPEYFNLLESRDGIHFFTLPIAPETKKLETASSWLEARRGYWRDLQGLDEEKFTEHGFLYRDEHGAVIARIILQKQSAPAPARAGATVQRTSTALNISSF